MWWCRCLPIEECRFVTTTDCLNDASIYRIITSGLTNDDCSDCSSWNGTFDLQYAAANTWESPASALSACNHVSGDPLWRLDNYTVGPTRYYRLEAVGLGYVWRILASSWQCGYDNILTYAPAVIVPNPCLSLPATITASPCVKICSFCLEDTETGTGTGTGDVLSDTLSVTLSGWTYYPNGCSDCTFMNGTFLLSRTRNCQWVATGTGYCGACPIEYSVSAYLSNNAFGYTDVGWYVYIILRSATGTCVGIPTSGPVRQDIVFRWGSGSFFPIDCTTTRTLTYIYGSATYVYWPAYGLYMQSPICAPPTTVRVN